MVTMVDNKNESSNLTSYDDGLTFSHAFRVLLDKHLKARINGNYRDFSLIIPAMVNGAFSCELFFKSLINKTVKEDQFTKFKIHNLLELYRKVEDLDSALAADVYTKFNCVMSLKKGKTYSYDDFIDKLSEYNSSFVDIRYFYEPKKTQTVYDLDFLEGIVATLESICIIEFGERPQK